MKLHLSLIAIVCFALFTPVKMALACSPPYIGPQPDHINMLYQNKEAKPLTEEEEALLLEYHTDYDAYIYAWVSINPCPMYKEEMERAKNLTEEERQGFLNTMKTLAEKWQWQ